MKKLLSLVLPEEAAEWLALALVLSCRLWALAKRWQSRRKAERALTASASPTIPTKGGERKSETPPA